MKTNFSNNIWINLAGFQLAWWCAILMGDQGLLILSLLLVLHLMFHHSPRSELILILGCGALGFTIDMVLTLFGVFNFGTLLPPLWLLLLWFCFAATLRQSLSLFQNRLKLAAMCGGVAGALTYIAAARLDAVMLGIAEFSLFLLLTLIWTFLFPLLVWLSRTSDIWETSDAF